MTKHVNIGWISDTHLDYTQYGKPERRRDFAIAFRKTVEDMVDSGIHTIIHTGDLFNSSRPSSESITLLQEVHEYLIAKGVRMLVCSGNHDWATPSWTDALRKVSMNGIETIDFKQFRIEGIAIAGYPSMSKDALIKHLNDDDLAEVDILMIHQMVKDFVGYPSPSAISIDEIPDKFQVVAVGDLHITDIRDRPSGGIIGYPGSTELCSVSEATQKHWIKLKFEDGKYVGYDKMSGRNRPVLTCNVTTDDDVTLWLDEYDDLEKMLLEKDPRLPMIIVKFPTTLPGVLDRLKQRLDPDKYIINEQPYFVPVEVDGTTVTADGPDVTIMELLQSKVPADDRIALIAAQLLNPDSDAKFALTAFVENRLKETEE